MRIDVCQRLPADHPLQPPFIQPLQTIPADAKFESEHVEPDSDIPVTTTSSQPKPTTQTSDPSNPNKFHALLISTFILAT